MIARMKCQAKSICGLLWLVNMRAECTAPVIAVADFEQTSLLHLRGVQLIVCMGQPDLGLGTQWTVVAVCVL